MNPLTRFIGRTGSTGMGGMGGPGGNRWQVLAWTGVSITGLALYHYREHLHNMRKSENEAARDRMNAENDAMRTRMNTENDAQRARMNAENDAR